MKKIHVYKVDGQPHASAAEVGSAILGKEPIQVVCHSVTTDIHGPLLLAICRITARLRYSRARNFQAALISAAVLVLLGWPLIYNAASIPEITVAARLASGVCVVLSLLAVVGTSIQTRRLLQRSSVTNTVTIVYKDDGLLPSATSWGQDQRRATFPWLGLGLVLFSVALNCVVIADYTRPAVLSDGTVRHRTSLTVPWATWRNTTRYIQDSFYVAYFYDEPNDMFSVLRVAYRVENPDLSTLPPTGAGKWLISLCSRMVNYAVENLPNDLPADATEEDIRLALVELFEYNEYRTSFISAIKTQWAERYASDLKLAAISYELLVVTRAEAVKDYERHAD